MEPWENDPIVQPAGNAAPWEADPIAEQAQAPERGLMGRINDTMESIPVVGAHFKAGREVLDGTAARAVGDTVGAVTQGVASLARPETWNRAAEGVSNDISAGTQGVNPIAMQEATGQAVGEIVKHPGMRPYVARFDGTMGALSDFPADQFATTTVEGTTYIIRRTATDSAGETVEEGPLASLGRLFGYSIPTTRAVVGPAAPRTAAQETAQAASDLGITPSFGMGGTARSKLAAAGEQFAPTAGPLKRDAERVTGEIATAATRLADQAGPGITPFDAGTALQEGGEAYVKGVRDFQSGLYKAVDEAIPAATPVAAPNTLAALGREADKLRKLPNTISADRLEALESGSLTWEQARALRTDIGTAMRSFDGAETNVAKGQLDQIYKALSTDLDAVVDAQGPAAKQAWNRANTYKRVSEDRISSAFGKILKADTPERAYSILTGMATEGTGSANITALKRVFQSLPEDDAAVVAGTVIRRLGRATAGAQDAAGEAFSPATFLTNWNRMSPEARATIARGGLDDGVAEGLNKLAKVAEKWRDTGMDRNRSNTGNAMLTGGMLTGFFTALFTGQAPTAAGIAATAGASHLSARALTNPRFLHALNRLAETGSAEALKRVASGEGVSPEIATEAANALRLLPGTADPSSPRSPERVGVPVGR